jgi:hypothetical protein
MVCGWYADRPMPWLSLPDYARQTGTPESTVRAAIRKGTIEGHQEQRAPGDPRVVWKVWVDDPQHQPQDDPQAPTAEDAPSQSPSAVAAATEPPAATMRLLDKLDERDETIRAKDAAIARLHGELRDATARASTAEAEAAAAERRAADLAERLAGVERERDALRARRWWRFW